MAMLLCWGASAIDFTEEENEAIAELKKAGLLDVDIERLLDEAYDEYYLDDDYELVDYDIEDEVPDSASERGGPSRRRRPGHYRRKQRPGARRNLLQILV